MQKAEYDLLIIGAGPGGYVAAIRGAQLGLRVGVIERKRVGGVCLNEGCIPSKALIRNAEVLSLFQRGPEFGITCDNLKADFGIAVDRSQRAVKRLTKGVEHLFKKNKIDLIKGTGRFLKPGEVQVIGEGGEKKKFTARYFIIASGTRGRPLPGLDVDHRDIITSDEALVMKKLPQSILIVGAGATGVEFSYIFGVYGVRVTLMETMPRLLPGEDHEISHQLKKAFKSLGIHILTESLVEEAKRDGNHFRVTFKRAQRPQTLEVEKIMIAGGRQANVEGLGLKNVGVNLEEGFIFTDDHLQTSSSGIYAIGDVAGKALLAHSAMAEGVYVAEKISGQSPSPINYKNIPSCVYGQPQVASIGWTEEQAKKDGCEVRIGKFPFQANGKAIALGETEGFIKIVADAKDGKILGAHMIGNDVTELIGELALARLLGATSKEIKGTIHPHPTLSEAIMEAGGAVYGEAIHI